MFKLAIKKFFDESSVHVFQYLTKKNGFLIYQIGVKVQEDLTVTYTSDDAIKVTDIPFPAVTFCFELVKLINDKEFKEIKSQLLTNNLYIANLTEKDLEIMQALSLIISENFLTKFKIPKISTTNLVEIIERRSIDFNFLVTRSDFGYLWAVHYAQILGPNGFCYNFNIVPANQLYNNLENASKHFNFSRNFYHPTEIHRYYRAPRNPIKRNVTYPMKVPLADGALQFFNAIYNRKMIPLGVYFDKIKEYKFYSPTIFIHNPYESYTKEDLHFHSNREEKLNLFIEPKQILVDETLMSYSSDVRQCYFQPQSENDTTISEKSLKFFKVYTKKNCRHECLINKTLEICGCVQFFMIHFNSTRICDLHDFDCFTKVENEMKNKDECKCYPYCGEIIYDIQIIKSNFVKKFKLEGLAQYQLTFIRTDIYDSMTVVRFREPSFFPYVLKRQFTELDFISYTGGALGLFLGFSILSFVEIFFYFTIKIIFDFIRTNGRISDIRNNEERKTKNEFRFYLENSTIHGMNQIGMRDRNFIERIFWLICLFSALIYSSRLSYEIYERYRNAPIAITFDSSERSVEEIPFPAITINHEITIAQEVIDGLWFTPIISKILNESTKTSAAKEKELFEKKIIPGTLCNYRKVIKDKYNNVNFEIENFVEKVEKNYSYIDWFKEQSAIWKQKLKPEFAKFLGHSGFGFTFNMLEPKKMFRENVSEDFLNTKFFTLKNPSESKFIKISHERYPLKGSFHDEFKILLKINEDLMYKEICSMPQFSVHSPYEIPGDFDEETMIKFYYGQDLDIVITPEVIFTDSELKKFNYKRRNCFFDGERKLTMFKVYSRRNCEQECYANFVLKHERTKCIGFYQIRNSTNPVCDYKKTYNLAFLYMHFILQHT